MSNGQEIMVPEQIENGELAIRRAPEKVLNEAKEAAKALQDVISRKAKPVRFNGEQYIEFEDWQTIGRFYGLAAKVLRTAPIVFGDVNGFEADAVIIDVKTGEEVSRAEAMCLSDEPNWKSKPLFQLRSMAQTRACAKAFRNVLAWVVVLAGYRPTPAEELPATEGHEEISSKPFEFQPGELYTGVLKEYGNKPGGKGGLFHFLTVTTDHGDLQCSTFKLPGGATAEQMKALLQQRIQVRFVQNGKYRNLEHIGFPPAESDGLPLEG